MDQARCAGEVAAGDVDHGEYLAVVGVRARNSLNRGRLGPGHEAVDAVAELQISGGDVALVRDRAGAALAVSPVCLRDASNREPHDDPHAGKHQTGDRHAAAALTRLLDLAEGDDAKDD